MTRYQQPMRSKPISDLPLDRRSLLLALFGAALPSLPTAVLAQQKGGGDKKGKGKGKGKNDELPIEGTVRQVSPQGLYVEGEDRARYLIGVADGSQVTLQGDVDASFLTPGAFVEFDVLLDRAGNPTEEVKAVTFVDASPLNPVGLFQASQPTSEGGKVESALFLVRGRVTTSRPGQLVVQAGERNVSIKIAEELALTCRLDGWNFASPGDSIRGNVEYVPQPNTGIVHVVARKLTIRTAKPLKPVSAKSAVSKSSSTKTTTNNSGNPQ